MKYTSADVSCIIPTKDRPEKLANLLASIEAQSCHPGRVLVIDGGQSVEHVVQTFGNRLPVEWYPCLPPGQIRQRNYGISLLKEHVLVMFLDDDLVFEDGSLEALITMWNRVEPKTAGIGLNLSNIPADNGTWLSRLLLTGGGSAGTVLPSGVNIPFTSLTKDIRTQWLGGGYTVWRKDILDMYRQEEVRTRWAVGEDLLFSYPIGQCSPLYACAAARARHEHAEDQAPTLERIRLGEYKSSMARFILTYQNDSLSVWAALWSMSARLILYCAWELLRGRKEKVQRICGLAEAVYDSLRILAGRLDVQAAQEDKVK